ncbi:hypothetical protein CBM2589_B140033 [Cupriavidus taiwanensis]|uniref:Uncharacterized protein n=1 Tax=Cupriavidus taiwanensis TaxID=164546 RepID=A0A975WWI9_9BURK|nr:hypothetical protein CBM2589_B140033 [Cupriavidus taiwanensis]
MAAGRVPRGCSRCCNDWPLVCSPLPLAGEGPGERAGVRSTHAPPFVATLALSPTLSRKREREPAIGHPMQSVLQALRRPENRK